MRSNVLTLLTVLLLAFVLIPAVVRISPQVYWDVDPLSQSVSSSATMLGPLGVAWINSGAVLVATLALVWHVRLGGRIATIDALLVLIGCVVALTHLPRHAGNGLHAGTWIASAVVALAVVHLSSHDIQRRWLHAGLIAMLAPLVLSAAWFVFVEHPATVQMYRENVAVFLQSKGWAFGSPHHHAFERRLFVNDATGAFGLSNIFGSILAALTLLAGGLFIHTLRQPRVSAIVLTLCMVLAGVLGVYLTHSRGAIVALLIGAVLLAIPLIITRHGRGRVLIPAAALAIIACVVLVVFVRGQLGPEKWTSDRSILFRYHYWQAAGSILRESPVTVKLAGLGPARFQDLYAKHKNPLNPEDVISTHNVFIDYITMLGVGGLAWSVLLVAWLVRAGRACADSPEELPQAAASPWWTISERTAFVALTLAAIIFGTQFAMQWIILIDGATLLVWTLGMAMFIILAALCTLDAWWSPRIMRMAAFAGAAALLTHGQIEMTFHNFSAAPLAWFIVALAAGHGPDASREPSDPRSFSRLWMPACLAVLFVAMLAMHTIPVTRQQLALGEAARLRMMQQSPQDAFDLALHAVPADPQVYYWQVVLHVREASAQSRGEVPGDARQTLEQAENDLQRAHDAGLADLQLLRLRAVLLENKGAILNDGKYADQAIDAWREVIRANPYHLQDYLSLGDLLWRRDRHAEAKAMYERCLRLNEQAYLDPLMQLSEQVKSSISRRLSE